MGLGLGVGVGVMWARTIVRECVFANEGAWYRAWYRVLDTRFNSAASASGPDRRKLWPGEHPDW